jgi:hypothetical protein
VVLFVAAYGAILLPIGIHESGWVNPVTVPATASVVRSWTVNDQGDSEPYAYVRFKTRSGKIVHTTIEPNTEIAPPLGARIPILYNRVKPHEAGYAGPGGDSVYGQGALFSGPPAFFFAAVSFAGALVLLTAGIWRLMGIIRTDVSGSGFPVRLRISRQVARAAGVAAGHDLEWRLMDRAGNEPGYPDGECDARILGRPAAGRMLIARLEDGQLFWPASRAQPVVAAGRLSLPSTRPGGAGSAQLLLAGYAQVVDVLGVLPVVIRRPPGAGAQWWGWFGALRPMVKTLITLHVRRRLSELGGALLRASLMCDSGSGPRRELAQASEECLALARTLPRRNLLAVLATVTATVITIVSPFLLLPHIPLSSQTIYVMLPAVAGALIFGTAPLYMFFQSIRYKRLLFKPAPADAARPAADHAASAGEDWDVYELERAAFTAVGVPQPAEWESRRAVRWLIGAVYALPVAIGFGIALPMPTLIVVGVAAACAAAWRSYRWLRAIHNLRAVPRQRGRAGSAEG